MVSAPPASNHPRIVCGPYQESGITVQQYKIYRKYGSPLFQPCTTLSANTFQFTDESLYLSIPGGQAGTDVQYYVTAVYNTNNETSPTNTVTINVQGSSIEKKTNFVSFFVTDYGLWQNYPNPFNPTTKISYQIPVASQVSIKVFDVLGNEVRTLVNEVKPEGYYEIEFKADNIPSGIYFYKMQTRNFTAVNKMILMR